MNAEEMSQYVTPDKDPRKNADHLFMYKGVNCRQTPRVFNSLDKLNATLLSSGPVKTIIELGTFYGAFTRVLRDHDISKDAEIFTLDIRNFPGQVPVEGVTHFIGDCWDPRAIDVLKNLINKPGRTLMFCDGDIRSEKSIRLRLS